MLVGDVLIEGQPTILFQGFVGSVSRIPIISFFIETCQHLTREMKYSTFADIEIVIFL